MIEKYNDGNINDVYRIKNKFVDLILRRSKFNNEFETYVLKKLQRYKFDIPLHIVSFYVKNEYIMIYEYIEGDTLKNFSDIEVNQIVNFLLNLHSIEVTKDEIDMKQPREDLQSMYQYIQRLEGEINKQEYCYICTEYEKLYREHINFENLNRCLIHSDIKKENLLINVDKLYVIDFGNCYIGSRLVDIVRVIMWLFLYNEEKIEFERIDKFCCDYFGVFKLNHLEYKMVPFIIRFCLLYNYVKDKYLYSTGILTKNYVNATSAKWFEILNNEDIIHKIEEIIKK